METAISSLGLRVNQRGLSQKPDIIEHLTFSIEVGKNDPSMDKSVILINLQKWHVGVRARVAYLLNTEHGSNDRQ